MSRRRLVETIAIAFMAALGAATTAIALAGNIGGFTSFGTVVLAGAVGALPGSITGTCVALNWRPFLRWPVATLAIALIAGASVGGPSICVFRYFYNIGD
jgi:hypothetical protein